MHNKWRRGFRVSFAGETEADACIGHLLAHDEKEAWFSMSFSFARKTTTEGEACIGHFLAHDEKEAWFF